MDGLNDALLSFQPYNPNGTAPTAENLKVMLAAHPNPILNAAADDPSVVRDISKMVNGHDLDTNTWSGDAVKAASRLDSYFSTKSPGKMYEVNIAADPEHMLDWDKPLSEQSKHVQDVLRQYGIGYGYQVVGPNGVLPEFHPTVEAASSAAKGVEGATGIARADDIPGQLAYYRLAGKMTGQKSISSPDEAAIALRNAGIPGIKYLDQGSRGSGEGTHNYVVFDDNIINILRKYGIAGLGLGLGAAAAGSNNNGS